MRIIKPYGRSHVEESGDAGRKRVLRLRPSDRSAPPRDIPEFARSHDELVIAQWISTIDKIATKPSGKQSPTDEQRAFRKRLGDAAWAFLMANGLLPGLKDATEKERLGKVWRFKVAPYGSTEYRPRRGRPGSTPPVPPSPKGRWYERFAGKADVADVDVAEIARKINEHLLLAEYRKPADAPNRRKGRIEARAESIAGNVPKPRPPDGNAGWTADDRKAYSDAGNVAGEIRDAAKEREKSNRRVTNDIAGEALFRHYARLFPGDGGKALSIQDARAQASGLFALHMAVKDCYSRVLKHHKKDQKAHGDARRRVSALLPDTMERLFKLVENKGANRDLNALVRLGKVIHYEASGGGPDNPADLVANWPADMTGSRYWTSDGQAEIKRNEAFVRIWRHVLALAQRTLTDWADPQGNLDSDILSGSSIRRATGDSFDGDSYRLKLDLLYGNLARLFKRPRDDAFQKSVLKSALNGIAALRHNAFHFKGLGGFANALAQTGTIDGATVAAIRNLWDADVSGRIERLRATMRGAHFEYYFDASQNRKLFAAFSVADPATIPLPRFARVLRRAENAWGDRRDGPRLPPSANRADLENPARLCQYTALKLLYERALRNWLDGCDARTLNGFIDRAVERATKAARDLNARKDEDRRAVIVAKADTLGRLADSDDVQAFFFNLSAETASEMRVQRGYDSDPDMAREQAAYIEDLKCDVVALAFRAYLDGAGFDFVAALPADTPKPDAARWNLDGLASAPVDASAEDWQRALYFLIHLVPVDEIGKLLHQIRKWDILAGKAGAAGHEVEIATAARQVQLVLGLYLDMHDAKFEGGAALTGVDAFTGLFERPADFNTVFDRQPGADDDRRIPRRGLREIMRFGHMPVLRPVFDGRRIMAGEVDKYRWAEEVTDGKSGIARWQEERETLHKKWVRDKRAFSPTDRDRYREALAEVVRHRHLASRVTLTDHARLHRLMMAVLGRLVDFSGLWERDLYFVTIAAIHETGCPPADILTADGLEYLANGQIVEALRNTRKESTARTVLDRLRGYFGSGNPVAHGNLRNDFAHFNMLRKRPENLNLTQSVDKARRLMAYDRKLKNAVSQSVIEILHREGFELRWAMDASHCLGNAALRARQAVHLGGKPGRDAIAEDLHNDSIVAMLAALFGGNMAVAPRSGVAGAASGRPARTSPAGQGQKSGENPPDGAQKRGRRRRNRSANRENLP